MQFQQIWHINQPWGREGI